VAPALVLARAPLGAPRLESQSDAVHGTILGELAKCVMTFGMQMIAMRKAAKCLWVESESYGLDVALSCDR